MVRLALAGLFVASAAAAAPPTSVHGQLDGTMASLRVTFRIAVDGPRVTTTERIVLPPDGVVTGGLVRAGGTEQRLALMPDHDVDLRFTAATTGDPGAPLSWAIAIRPGVQTVELAIAAPRRAVLELELEIAVPSCAVRDERSFEVPADWKALSPELMSRGPDDVCRHDGADIRTLAIAAPHRDIAVVAGRLDAGDRIARVELDLPARLGEVPADLVTAIVVDASRSLRPGELAAQRAVIASYLRLVPASKVAVVAYARAASTIVPWTTAGGAVGEIDRAIAALRRRNGSDVEAGLREATRQLARVAGTKRIIVVGDERLSTRRAARLGSIAIPAETVIHTVQVFDNPDGVARSDGSVLSPLAVASEGLPASTGTQPDATMLVRPIRFDAIAIRAPGWTQVNLVQPAPSAQVCPIDAALDEGQSCVWWAEGVPVAGPVVVEGLLWNHRFRRVLLPDAWMGVAIARELAAIGELTSDARPRIEAAARACIGAWALFVAWGGGGQYSDIEPRPQHFRGGTSSSSTTCGARVAIGQPLAHALDLRAQLAPAIAACNALRDRVEITVETTFDEIVDVEVTAPEASRRCIEDAVWDVELVLPTGRPHDSTRATFGT